MSAKRAAERIGNAVQEYMTYGIPFDTLAIITEEQEKGVAELKAENEKLRDIEKAYEELIFHVGSKFPGETRHQTALRYIRQAETPSDCLSGAT